jgi:hypothetical protein
MGSHHRTPPQCTCNPSYATSPIEQDGTRRDAKIHRGAPSKRDHLRILEPIHCKLLFHQKERQKTMTSPRLPTYQQMDEEK